MMEHGGWFGGFVVLAADGCGVTRHQGRQIIKTVFMLLKKILLCEKKVKETEFRFA